MKAPHAGQLEIMACPFIWNQLEDGKFMGLEVKVVPSAELPDGCLLYITEVQDNDASGPSS